MSPLLAAFLFVGGFAAVGLMFGVILVWIIRAASGREEGAPILEGLPLVALLAVGLFLIGGAVMGLRTVIRYNTESVQCSWIGDEEAFQIRIRDHGAAPRPYLRGSSSGYITDPPEMDGRYWVWTLPTSSTQLETISGRSAPAFDAAGEVTVFSHLDFDSKVPPDTCRLSYHGP